MRSPSRLGIGYVLVLTGCLLGALTAAWTTFGLQIDNDAYDFMYRLSPPSATAAEAVMVAIDERTLTAMRGMRQLRAMLAAAVEAIAAQNPKAIVVDVILADQDEAALDKRLESAFRRTRNLILACELTSTGWEDPVPRFRQWAAAVGHAHAEPDPFDNVTRRLPLEKASGRDRRWALSLEAFRLARQAPQILESPEGLEVAGRLIPAARTETQSRPLLISFLRQQEGASSSIPQISILELRDRPESAARLRDKVVFVGVTAQSAADARHMTPFSGGRPLPGVEIHALAFETLAQGRFFTPVSDSAVLFSCILISVAAGLTFAYQAGWRAYGGGLLLLAAAHLVPFIVFRFGSIFPYAAPVSTAWLSVTGAATYQHFVVRRLLRKSESARTRYQQAIQFVTHEMRTPLTAIQGSSELMGRYNLGADKSKQLAQMINNESRRLARMIQTFLDMERLSAGHMELKHESFQAGTIVDTCLERVRALAERKQIVTRVGDFADGELVGDRELMEYAVYNLLNNAVKYSPAETEITVTAARDGDRLRLSVRDQGIGMDETELRSIFRKFYRTQKAEASGEAGTGIGLAIVEQIVTHHGGRIEVTSKPGAGSCFTMVLPLQLAAVRPRAV